MHHFPSGDTHDNYAKNFQKKKKKKKKNEKKKKKKKKRT